jgi:Zn-dependent protease with chaperone function
MARSASSLLAARSLPSTIAGVAALLVLSSFLINEPRDRVEPVGLPLAVGAAFGFALLVGGLVRGAVALARTRAAVARLKRDAVRVTLPGWSGRAWLVDDEAAGVFVAGVVRPALLISRRVLDACTREELAGVLAHERAHASARDHRKRFVLRLLPDLIGSTPLGAQVERVWQARAEEAADAAAVRSDPTLSGEIAGALVKLARLRRGPEPAIAIAFDSGGSIERRVRLLLRGASPVPARSAGGFWIPAALAAALAAGFVPALSGPIHRVIEAMVNYEVW